MTTSLREVSALRAALPSGLVALDFDGTLAPISPHPDDARPVAGVAQLLRDVRATGAALAIVSGRSVATLLRISGFETVPGIVIYGLHGVERWENGRLRAPATPAGIEELRVTLPQIVARVAGDPAVWIEDKELSLVVHTRLTADPDRLVGRLRVPVTEATEAAGLEVRPGKEVLEIVIPGTDKGTALRELIGEGTAAVCYAGDDVGDMPAVAEVDAWSARTARPKLTVAVTVSGPGPLDGLTDLTVPDPLSLVALLRQVVGLPAAREQRGVQQGLELREPGSDDVRDLFGLLGGGRLPRRRQQDREEREVPLLADGRQQGPHVAGQVGFEVTGLGQRRGQLRRHQLARARPRALPGPADADPRGRGLRRGPRIQLHRAQRAARQHARHDGPRHAPRVLRAPGSTRRPGTGAQLALRPHLAAPARFAAHPLANCAS